MVNEGRKFDFGGTFSGPLLAVACAPSALRHLAYDLSKIPTLPWMRGSIILAEATDGVSELEADAVLDLSGQPDASHIDILQACVSLGMIKGRGVPKTKNQGYARAG